MTSTMTTEPTQARRSKIVSAGEGKTLNVFGVRVEVLLTGEDTAGQFCSYECIVEPGAGAPPHVHSHDDETFYILEGTFEVLMGETVVTARAGDIAHLPRGLAHTFKNIGETTGRFVGTATPAGHEHFFEDADALGRSGEFTPEKAIEMCRRHGLELLI
ncbi:MAG: cupin domain-containing protein [Capsulimonas sp.]|uniref:cupin domain-containing protein n=1 Tax=Capsulimonas sp. TaxID=2494211 RepID=UPI00326562C4